MAYTAWSVVYGEQPTAAKWNQLGTNDAGFKDGTNIDAGAITAAHLGDTGWNNVSVNGGTNGFQNYTAGVTPQYRRVGKVVFCSGALKPNHATNSIGQVMFTLPAGSRPQNNFTQLNQGSGSSSHNLTIATNGDVILERYNGTMATSSWLTFSFCFVAA